MVERARRGWTYKLEVVIPPQMVCSVMRLIRGGFGGDAQSRFVSLYQLFHSLSGEGQPVEVGDSTPAPTLRGADRLGRARSPTRVSTAEDIGCNDEDAHGVSREWCGVAR